MNGNPNDHQELGSSDRSVIERIDPERFVDQVKSNNLLPHNPTNTPRYHAEMLHEAIVAAQHAYAPYSKFHVGAALITTAGQIYAGCNVENVMYNGMSHAELTAISAAITHQGPDMRIQEMIIWTPTDTPTPSCGGCRQLIREHAANMDITIWSYCESPDIAPLGMTVAQLLPESFGPENL